MFRKFQSKLSLRLLLWSCVSVTSGLLMMRRCKFWKSLGTQFITWGLIDALIAVGGQRLSDNRLSKTQPEDMPERVRKEKRNLSIALWVNAGLDVLYILGGLHWMKSKDDGSVRGNGLGVVIQGVFLLIFDIFHALKLRQIDKNE